MVVLIQFAVGLLFGLGLVVAGMSNPAKVLNFLDIAAVAHGNWDASLAFVMIGAIAVASIGFRLVLKWPRPFAGQQFHLPSSSDVDMRIIIGPAIFGIGWGLVGLCPGPAFASLSSGGPAAIKFVIAMLTGMIFARWQMIRLSKIQSQPVSS